MSKTISKKRFKMIKKSLLHLAYIAGSAVEFVGTGCSRTKIQTFTLIRNYSYLRAEPDGI